MLINLGINYYVVKELICQDKYKKIKIKLKHRFARTIYITNFLWGHCYPCYGLLVTSPLGFKARVLSVLFPLGRGVYLVRSLRFISGATPANLLAASMAAELISSTYLQRHWWNLIGRPLAP